MMVTCWSRMSAKVGCWWTMMWLCVGEGRVWEDVGAAGVASVSVTNKESLRPARVHHHTILSPAISLCQNLPQQQLLLWSWIDDCIGLSCIDHWNLNLNRWADFIIGGKGSCQKKTVFFKSVYPPTHPRVFVRFGRSKGEIWVEKGDFRGDLGGFWGVWTLFGS